MYAAFLSTHEFKWNEFIEGQLTGFFFILGCLCYMTAMQTGPGGPINALLGIQVIF